MNETREIEMSNCPYCGSHTLAIRSNRTESIKLGRKRADVEGLSRTYCETCRQEFTTPAQHDANLALLNAAKSSLSPILPREIRMIRANLAITQDEAQRMFAGGKHAFSKYERGLVVPTVASARLMRLAVSVPGVAVNLALASGVEPRAAWSQLGNPQAPSKQIGAVTREVTVEDVSIADWPATQPSADRMLGVWWPTLRTQMSEILEAAVAPESALSSAIPSGHSRIFVGKSPGRTTFWNEFQKEVHVAPASLVLAGNVFRVTQLGMSSDEEPLVVNAPVRQRAHAARAPGKARTH